MRASSLFPELRLPRDTRPEGTLVKAILDYLRSVGVPAWRNNTGGASYTDRRGNRRFVRYGVPGGPDVLAVLPGSGRLVGIEAKRPGNVLSQEQREFADMLRAAGALTVVAYSVGDVEEALTAEDTGTNRGAGTKPEKGYCNG